MHVERDSPRAAQVHADESARIARAVLEGDPTDVAARRTVADAIVIQAYALEVSRPTRAESRAAYEEVLGIRESLWEADRNNARFASELALVHATLRRVNDFMFDYVAALHHGHKALEIREEWARLRPANPTRKFQLAQASFALGSIYDQLGNHSRALELWERGLDIWSALVEANPRQAEWAGAYGRSLLTVARDHMDRHEPEKQAQLLRRALAVQNALPAGARIVNAARIATMLEIADAEIIIAQALPPEARRHAYAQSRLSQAEEWFKREQWRWSLAPYGIAFDDEQVREETDPGAFLRGAEAVLRATDRKEGAEWDRRAQLAIRWIGVYLRRTQPGSARSDVAARGSRLQDPAGLWAPFHEFQEWAALWR